MLASDAAHLYMHLEQGRAFPDRLNVGDMLEGHHTLAPPREFARGTSCPGHDPLVMRRYPPARPELDNIVARLDARARGLIETAASVGAHPWSSDISVCPLISPMSTARSATSCAASSSSWSRARSWASNSLWANEHHFDAYGGIIPSPPILLSALAQRTKRVRLGTSVVVLPLHNPIEIAEQMAMIDLMSNGRVELGFGRGFVAYDYDRFGVPLETGQARMQDALEVILKALVGRAFQPQRAAFPLREPAALAAAAAASAPADMAGLLGHARRASSMPGSAASASSPSPIAGSSR